MLLAVDTATARASIALHDGLTLRAECTWEAANRHTVTLVRHIEQLLAASELTPGAITALAVCTGPGSYTGVRIGVAFAKGMAQGCQLPLVGVSTLDILASAQPRDERPLVALFAAGRQRVGYARYRWADTGWHAETPVTVVTWPELAQRIQEPVLVLGEIDAAGRKALQEANAPVELPSPARHLRRAGFLADLAWERIKTDRLDDPALLLPVYAK
ncbi:MAG: tRNA (adenosine(37)-N6)-threonylcarbamoyltransferase complex dimerization subunit type 1 TsaB [Anaerolineae bacterium]|nr:tRNA (adenosine(37)-N6)-threonylcarbamoyltransferase complex dimerization subunit type 1 TsaB [Anaerolineae bacterium]